MPGKLPDDGLYPAPLAANLRPAGSFWRVGLLAIVFIVAAVVISVFGDRIPGDYVMVLLGLLAVVGVFSLFALAAGLFRFTASEEGGSLASAVVDSLPFGAVVTDRDGRIVYANAQYGQFPGALSKGVPVGVPRLFAGEPEVSEAIYRLSRAARDGRDGLRHRDGGRRFRGAAAALCEELVPGFARGQRASLLRGLIFDAALLHRVVGGAGGCGQRGRAKRRRSNRHRDSELHLVSPYHRSTGPM